MTKRKQLKKLIKMKKQAIMDQVKAARRGFITVKRKKSKFLIINKSKKEN